VAEAPVGLFGGSFDPVHLGHLIAARVAAERLGLAEVRFIPAAAQPHKGGRHVAGPEDRLAMLRLAIAGEPGFAVETLELERPGPSYTVDTLRALRAREPERPFILLVGADAARDLPRWREAEVIPSLARVAVLTRPGSEPPVAVGAVEVVAVPAVDISATEVRRRVADGRRLRFWVPDAVVEYIATRGLYRMEHR
jgi:nicotinate-nucleotide adenylyltransferase